MHLHHVTLNTGHVARTSRADVGEAAIARLVPWLERALALGEALPLPVPELSHFAACARVDDGALVVTVYAPSGPHVAGKPADATMPVIVFAVGRRSRSGRRVWDALAELSGMTAADVPPSPWIAVQLLPTLAAHADASRWLGDFERCAAWAWLTRRADLREV